MEEMSNLSSLNLEDINLVNNPNVFDNETFDKMIKIGDTVKIRNANYTVIVKYIDYVIAGYGTVEFAGVKEEGDDCLVLFNKKDIEKIIENTRTK